MVLKALNLDIISVPLFILGFYVCLVGSKVLVAIVVGKSRRFLRSTHYIYVIRFLGIVLLIFAALFIQDSLQYFGLL